MAEALGMTHFDAMLDSRKLPTRAMLEQLIVSFDAAPRPFMLKCSGGQDRTSFAAAVLYLIHRGGWAAHSNKLPRNTPVSPTCIFPKNISDGCGTFWTLPVKIPEARR